MNRSHGWHIQYLSAKFDSPAVEGSANQRYLYHPQRFFSAEIQNKKQVTQWNKEQ